jgi:hypothetical protein
MRGLKLIVSVLLGVVLSAQLSFVVDGNYLQTAKADGIFDGIGVTDSSQLGSLYTNNIKAIVENGANGRLRNITPNADNLGVSNSLAIGITGCDQMTMPDITSNDALDFPSVICSYGVASLISSQIEANLKAASDVVRDLTEDAKKTSTTASDYTFFKLDAGGSKLVFNDKGIAAWRSIMGDETKGSVNDADGSSGSFSKVNARLQVIYDIYVNWQRWVNNVDPVDSSGNFTQTPDKRSFRNASVPNAVTDPKFDGSLRDFEIRRWCVYSSTGVNGSQASFSLNGSGGDPTNPDGRDCASAQLDQSLIIAGVDNLRWNSQQLGSGGTGALGSGYYSLIGDVSKSMAGSGMGWKGVSIDTSTPTIGAWGSYSFPDSGDTTLGNFMTKHYVPLLKDVLDFKFTILGQASNLRNVAINSGLSPSPLAYTVAPIIDPDAAKVGRCGGPTGLDIILAIKEALCGVVDTTETLSLNLLTSSALLLGKMTGIAPGTKIGSGALDSFLTSLVPVPLLADQIDISLRSPFVGSITQALLGLIAMLTILFSLAAALSGVVQLGINTYSIKKILPGLLLGFILSFFGVFMTRAAVEVTSSASKFIVDAGNNVDVKGTTGGASKKGYEMHTLVEAMVGVTGKTDPSKAGFDSMVGTGSNANQPDMSLVFKEALFTVALMISAVLLFMLSFLLVIRGLVILILTALSPIAFFSSGVGPMNAIWTRWWKTASGWLFMPIVINIWLWIAIRFFIAGSTGGAGPLGAITTGLVGYGFGVFCVYMAMRTPFSMAGEASAALNKWNSLGKSAWNKTGGAGLKELGAEAKAAAGLIPGAARLKNYRKDLKDRTDHRRHNWAEGATARGAKRVRNREEAFRERQEAINASTQEIDDEKLEKVSIRKKAADADILAVQNNAALSQAQKDAQVDAIKVRFKGEKDAIEATYTDQYADLRKKQDSLASDRNSLKGLGASGRMFAKSQRQKQFYDLRNKEHQQDEAIVAAVAGRELKAGKSGIAEKYRHMTRHMTGSNVYAQHANAEAQYAERTNINNDPHLSWIREYGAENQAFSELGVEDEKQATNLAALEVFRHNPAQRPGESSTEFNFRRIRYEKSKAQWKAIAREQYETGRKGSGNSAKISQAVDALRGVHWQDVPGSADWDNSRTTDHLKDRAQGVGALSASLETLKQTWENKSKALAPDDIKFAVNHILQLENAPADLFGKDLLHATDKALLNDIKARVSDPNLGSATHANLEEELKGKIKSFTERGFEPGTFANRMGQYGADPHFTLDETIDWRYDGKHQPINNPGGTP